MTKEEAIEEIDSRVRLLESNIELWRREGEIGEKITKSMSSEIMRLLLQRDDLVNGTHVMEIVFLKEYLRLLKDKNDVYKIQEVEEQIIELETLDYILINGFSRDLKN